MKTEIKLGDTVKCKYTGYTGVAVARTDFINGCIQFLIAPKWDKKTIMQEEIGIDSQSLILIKKKKQPREEKESTGGAMTMGLKQRGF